MPDGVNFGTEADRKIATLLFVVALKSQRQLSMLQELAFFCSDLENIQRLSDCRTIDEAQKFWLKPKVTSEKIGSKNQFILKCSIIIEIIL